VAGVLHVLGNVLVLLMPFIFLGVYLRYGRERSFTVPEYLSFTPNTALKPWQVNLLFKGDALDSMRTGSTRRSLTFTGRRRSW